MSFDRRDIRRAMDVFTLDNTYLGTVLAVRAGPPSAALQPSVTPANAAGSAVTQGGDAGQCDGERLGPGPTQALGNRGPVRQAARNVYGTQADGAEPLGRGALVVGRWWGLRGRRTIPLDVVQTVSLERVVLKLTRAELHAAG